MAEFSFKIDLRGTQSRRMAHERPPAKHVTSPFREPSQAKETFFGKRTAPAYAVSVPNREHWRRLPAPFGSWMPSSRCATVRFPHDSAQKNRVMITHIIATVILAVTFGAFWHNRPARSPNARRRYPGFRLVRVVNRVLGWPALMPRLSTPAGKKEAVFLKGKGVLPERQTGFFRQVLRAHRGLNPRRRILVDRATVESSIPATLFKSKANRDELVAARTT